MGVKCTLYNVFEGNLKRSASHIHLANSAIPYGDCTIHVMTSFGLISDSRVMAVWGAVRVLCLVLQTFPRTV